MDQKVVQKIGKYEIVAELGQGGMGVVYKARDPFINRLVALKTITPELVSDPEILKRFYREAQSAGTLQHPNIVTIYDLGEADGRPYIAMEFIEGESLQSIINRRARIPLAAKLRLVQQFCEGLDHAHKHGFVHRDVKPANILVTNEGVVKVVDFGIVHLESTNLTKTGMFLGTIHYASPEQINDGRVDSRSDLWSVTAVVYEFIAYKKAFDGSNIAAIIAKVLSAEPEPLSRLCPGVPVELDQVISKGLKKNIDERYQSLDEMLGGLLPIARGLQHTFIGDLLVEAKDLRDKGDYNGAQEKVRAILILDNTHAEAKRLYGEVSSEIHRVGPQQRAKKLVSEAEQAFSRGEFADAVKMLTEAAELNPADTAARNLKDKALREQQRQKDLQEAFTDGQRSMKQGDLTTAEQAFHKVLQLDENHAQAAQFLHEIQQDRLTRERDFRLKEVLWEVDNLISASKFEEAQGRLLEIQQDFPDSQEILQKLHSLDPLIRAERLVKEGERAFSQGEYGEAVRALTQALEVNPQDAAALELKERAVQERDRLRQVREALSNGQRAMRQGDMGAAEQEFTKALQLDPGNSQATSLMAQIRQSQVSRERESHFQQVMQQIDQFAAEGKFENAQQSLMELQQEFPDSNEIHLKSQRLDQQMRVGGMVASGQQALDQGEFGEAVRIFSEALDLDPANAQVRDLKTKAVQERDRLRQVREAISAGQKCMRAGDSAGAEREFQRALQLDPNNAQAKNLLAQIPKEPAPSEASVLVPVQAPVQAPAKEKEKGKELDARAREILAQADRLMARKKFDEAKRKLKDLQKSYPDSEEIQEKLQAATERRSAAPAPTPPPPPVAVPAVGGSPLSEAARLEHLAEELRRNLQSPSPRAAEAAPTAKTPAPVPPPVPAPVPELNATLPDVPPPLQATQVTESPAAEGGFSATSMMPTAKLKAPAAPEVLPPPLPPEPPARKPQAPSAAMPPPAVEPKKPVAARPLPSPAVIAKAEPAKKSPMIMIAVIVAVFVMAIGGFMIFHKSKPVVEPPPITNNGGGNNQQSAQQRWQEVFNQAETAKNNKQWDEAISKYNQVADNVDKNDPLREQALGAINVIKQQQQGTDVGKIESKTFQEATAALKQNRYAQAKGLFQTVISLNVQDSTLAPQAKSKIEEIDQYLSAEREYQAAEDAERRNDLDGALNQYDKIANGTGPFASKAKARIPELQKMKTELAANAALKGDFEAAVQAENNNDLQGALDRFRAIQSKGGTFGSEAGKRITEITAKMSQQAGKQKFDAAVQAESSGQLDSAQSQFNALLSNPDYKDQASAHLQAIKSKIEAQRDDQKFADAVNKENSGDLKGASDEYKSLLGKKPEAADRYAAVEQKIAAKAAAATEQPRTPVTQPSQPTTTATSTPAAGPRPGSVKLLASGDYQAWSGPVSKGQMMPDTSIEGGLKPAGSLSVPAMDVPAGATVVFIISIDPSGNVNPVRKTADDNGIGAQVMQAARSWKFAPPTVKGKPVMTSIQVKVTY